MKEEGRWDLEILKEEIKNERVMVEHGEFVCRSFLLETFSLTTQNNAPPPPPPPHQYWYQANIYFISFLKSLACITSSKS